MRGGGPQLLPDIDTKLTDLSRDTQSASASAQALTVSLPSHPINQPSSQLLTGAKLPFAPPMFTEAPRPGPGDHAGASRGEAGCGPVPGS